ncbi:MAG: hypothetical protein QN140_02595, partial [Armatimonadota bacterium]|nr:hypothetical protein [Armatimonadota bacterium]
HRGRPYPPGDITEVRYLLFDARNELAGSGRAQRAREGWRVILSPQATARLSPGSSRLEVIVISRAVSIPGFASVTFTALTPQ